MLFRNNRLCLQSFVFSSSIASLLLFTPVLGAAPRDPAAAVNIPARFEPVESNQFGGRGFGYGVAVSSSGYRLAVAGRSVSVTFEGARAGVAGVGESPFRFKTNYYRGNERRQAASFAKVRYENALPGIDVLYRETKSQLEFDFEVRKGADPRRIVMRYDGQDALDLDSEGNLVLMAGGEQLVQQVPVIYQKSDKGLQLISGNYKIVGLKEVAFEVGAYDRSRPLVIDPVVLYSGFITGGGKDTAVAVSRDAQGYLYVIGHTGSTDLVTVNNPKQGTQAGDQDLFVAKINPYNPGDSVTYLSYLGGSGLDEAKAMFMTSPGVLYVVGSTDSPNFPTTTGAYKTAAIGGKDAFYMRLDLDPSLGDALTYSTYYGGTAADGANAVTVDGAGNAYIAGYSASGDLPFGGTPVQAGNRGGWDAFLAVFNSSGTLTYSTAYGGAKTDIGTGVAVDTDGTVILAGTTGSEDFPLAGNAYDSVYRGGVDLFVARFVLFAGLDGLVYSSYLGGTGTDDLKSIKFDSAGRLVLVGQTRSANFPIGQAALQTENRGESDLFVTVLDLKKPGGSALVYSTYLGGNGADVLLGTKIESSGSVLLTGYTYSTNFPVTSSAYQSTNAGSPDMFVARVDYSKPGGDALTYSTYLGGVQADNGYGVESDAAGYLYVVGNTTSKRFPASAGERDNTAGDTAAVIFAMQACTVTLSSAGTSVGAAGATGLTFLVTAASDCTWSATSNVDWISVTGGASGTGNGTVTFRVDANQSGDSRVGVIGVTDKSYTVTQAQ